MGEIVNLRRVRKAKRRAQDAAEADAARLIHGRRKDERTATALEQEQAARRLEAHRRDRPGADGNP